MSSILVISPIAKNNVNGLHFFFQSENDFIHVIKTIKLNRPSRNKRGKS